MKRLISTLLVFFCVIIGLFSQESQTYIDAKKQLQSPNDNMVLVTAHSAAHQKYPENSIASIEQAIRIVVDIVELDIRVTKDWIPILMHDGTIDRTTSGTGKPHKMTYEALQKFQLLGSEREITKYKTPTLEEVLQLTKGKIWIDLDMKTYIRQLDNVVDVLQKYSNGEGCFFMMENVLRFLKNRVS